MPAAYAVRVPDRRTSILEAAISVIARRGVRGLRVEEVAEAAGVAVSLLYYYFGSRNGLVRATLDHANERAAAATSERAGDGAPSGLEAVERTLLAEFDAPALVRETSVVWGEILASAVFEPELRDQVRAAGRTWTELVAGHVRAGTEDGSVRAGVDPGAAAERLTALVDGLSARWLAGMLDRRRARELLAGAIRAELADPAALSR
jgi:AcrR family transcriptional regulator